MTGHLLYAVPFILLVIINAPLALAAVNARLALPQGTRIIPIDNNRRLFPEAFLECAAANGGSGISVVPPTTSASSIAGATFELHTNDPVACGDGHAHCLVASNPNGASGLSAIRLQCGATTSPYLQFQSPASAASRLICRDSIVHTYPAEGSQQSAPRYVTFRVTSDDADPLDVATVGIIDSLSAVQFRAAGLDNTADEPYLYYCPDLATASPPSGTSAAALDSHQQALIANQQCVSFHSAATRSSYTHLHGYFLILRTALGVAVSGAPDGIVVTFRTKSSWGNCTSQLTFKTTAANVLAAVSVADPPAVSTVVPSGSARLNDGTYGIVAGSGYVALSLTHPNLGASNAVNENVLYQVTPVDIGPNCLMVCYVANPSEDTCFSSVWPQLPFTMSGSGGDSPLYLKMEAQGSYGPCMGTIEVRRVISDTSTGDVLGTSEPLFITASTLKVVSNPSVPLGPLSLKGLVAFSGVESPLYDTSSQGASNRRGGFEAMLYPPLVSRSPAVSDATAAALLGATPVSSSTPTVCSVSATSGGASAPSVTLSSSGQQVFVSQIASGTCQLAVAPAASSQSLPLAITVGATTTLAALTTTAVTTTSPQGTSQVVPITTTSTGLAPSSTSPTPTSSLVGAGGVIAADDEGGGVSVAVIAIAIVAALLVVGAILLICLCRRRIKNWLWGPPEKQMSNIKGDDSDFHNPAASMSRKPQPLDTLPHPTDMPGSPSLIVLSPRAGMGSPHYKGKRAGMGSPHYALNVGNAQNTRGATEDDEGWDVRTALASPPDKPMLPIGLSLVPPLYYRESPGDGRASPEAALASALSTSLNTSYASPGILALRPQQHSSVNIPPDFKHFSTSPQGASLTSPMSHVFAANNSISALAASPLTGPLGPRSNRIPNPMAGVANALRSPQSPQNLPLPPSSPYHQNRRISNPSAVPPALASARAPFPSALNSESGTPQRRPSIDFDFALDRPPTGIRQGSFGRSADAYDPFDGSSKNLDRTVAPREAASPGHSQMNPIGGGSDSPGRDHTQVPTDHHYPYPTSPGASLSFVSGPFRSPSNIHSEVHIPSELQHQRATQAPQQGGQPQSIQHPNNFNNSTASHRSATHPTSLPHRVVDPHATSGSEFSPPSSYKKPQK